MTSNGPDYLPLAHESQTFWERIAGWWDDRMAEGDRWHMLMIAPAVERLLAIQPGEKALDLACGNGWFARRLAAFGARVTACDFSPTLLDRARQRSAGQGIDYRLIDLCQEQQLSQLATRAFDAAICNMAIMDMAAITPLLRAVHRCLRPNGRFVFSILHPCFNTTGSTMLAERDDYAGERGAVTCGILVKRYLSLGPAKGIADTGQPAPYYYFHRPLSALVNSFGAAGLAMDAIEEPSLREPGEAKLPVGWSMCPDLPPILAARLRPVNPSEPPA